MDRSSPIDENMSFGSMPQEQESSPQFGVPAFHMSRNPRLLSNTWQRGNTKAPARMQEDDRSFGPPEPMQNWLSNDAPWNPFGSFPSPIDPFANSGQNSATSAYAPDKYSYMDYQNRAMTSVPSECETAPGDSGYGSRPTYSTGVASNDGNDGGLDTHFLEQLQGVNFEQPLLQSSPQQHIDPRISNPVHKIPGSVVKDLKFKCRYCPEKMRTQSEHKKHVQRHEKPFRCNHSDCEGTGKGFSSPNDLTRHKKSVHQSFTSDDDLYLCHHGSCASRKDQKLWPRADNFRSHLNRVHGIKVKPENHLKEYVYRPNTLTNELEGVGTAVSCVDPESSPINLNDPSGVLHQRNLENSPFPGRALMQVSGRLEETDQFLRPCSTSSESDKTTVQTTRESDLRYIRPGVLNEHGSTASTSETRNEEPDQQWLHFKRKTGQGRRGGARASTSAPQGEQMEGLTSDGEDTTETPTNGPIHADGSFTQSLYSNSSHATSDDADDDSYSESLRDRHPERSIPDIIRESDSGQLLDILRSLPKKLLESALEGIAKESDVSSSSQSAMEPKPPLLCTQCSKRFRRPCELKKHMKRHEKPYGCTYYGCNKSFGSKNDWKRHESSQHSQIEAWYCDVQSCQKVTNRRETFKRHVQDDHKLTDLNDVEESLEASRIGRHCDSRFWCGFCVKVVTIETVDKDTNMWTERCDHIDNHLFGKKDLIRKPISDWKYIEEELESGRAIRPNLLSGAGPSHLNLDERSGKRDSRKRPATEVMDSGATKKQNPSPRVSEWTCCRCGTFMMGGPDRCTDCGHFSCTRDCTFSLAAEDDEKKAEGYMGTGAAQQGDNEST